MTGTVLITGGAGGIATRIRPLLGSLGSRIRLLDEVEPSGPIAAHEEVVRASILDGPELARACEGVDLVVHLAGFPAERTWPEILAVNIDGTQKVFAAAHAAGVRRVLNASTNHAVGFTALDAVADADVLVPRPDSYYGVSKAAGEAIGSVFADRFGMSVVSCRIVNATTMRDTPTDRICAFTPADIVRLIAAVAALETPGHRIVWGVSRAGERWFPLGPGRAIGFDPQDDETLPGDEDVAPSGPLGHDFTTRPLGEHWS